MNNSIIIFDGDCTFCNRFIQFVVDNDNNFFKFIDRNSHLFEKIKSDFAINEKVDDETIYLIENNRVFEKSTAIILILRKTGKITSFISKFLRIIPLVLRDFLYDRFSKNRKKIFKKTTCSIKYIQILQQRTIKSL